MEEEGGGEMSNPVDEALKNLDNAREHLEELKEGILRVEREFEQAEHQWLRAKYDELMALFTEKGLPRVRIDEEIHSIQEFVMVSLGRYSLTISRDCWTASRYENLDRKNKKAYESFKNLQKTFAGRIRLSLGLYDFPQSMEEIWTIEGSQGECERIAVYPGLTVEQVKEMGK